MSSVTFVSVILLNNFTSNEYFQNLTIRLHYFFIFFVLVKYQKYHKSIIISSIKYFVFQVFSNFLFYFLVLLLHGFAQTYSRSVSLLLRFGVS
jgi:hypothetical protein